MTEERRITECNCKYQDQDAWGYNLFKMVDEPKYWEGVGRGSLSNVRAKMEAIDAPVLVTCRGCGKDLLREYNVPVRTA